MSDIFISYSSKDRPWVERFAKMLGTYGWSIWWDRNIPTGESFNAVIRHELRTARCAIVVWSQQSVDSEWVQAEADEARKQDKYLPVRIDQSEIPLGFTQRTFQSLLDWDPDVDHPGFSQLLKDIERLVKSPPQRIEIGSRPWWKRVHPLWLVSLPTLLAATIVVGLMLWPISAQVRVELTTKRVEFEIGATSQGKTTLGGFEARSLTIEKFTTLIFEPETFEVADPSQYDEKKDAFPPSAWKPLTSAGSTVTLAAKDQTRHPRVTVEGLDGAAQATIHLDAMAVKQQAHVTMEARGGKNDGLTVKVAGQDGLSLSLHEPFKLIADHAELRDLPNSSFQENDELTYRATLPERSSWIEIASASDGLILSPTFASSQLATSIFSGIPVATLDFTRQDSAGERVGALTDKGTITFPGYQHLGNVSIDKDDAIGLEQLDEFTIKEITLAANGSGLHLVGIGMAKQIRTKTGQIPIAYRLTKFDDLWHNARLALFFTIVAAVFTTSLGAYRLWKEFNR